MSTNSKADWLHVRMTTELSNRIKDRADSVGVTTSEWARRVLEMSATDAQVLALMLFVIGSTKMVVILVPGVPFTPLA